MKLKHWLQWMTYSCVLLGISAQSADHEDVWYLPIVVHLATWSITSGLACTVCTSDVTTLYSCDTKSQFLKHLSPGQLLSWVMVSMMASEVAYIILSKMLTFALLQESILYTVFLVLYWILFGMIIALYGCGVYFFVTIWRLSFAALALSHVVSVFLSVIYETGSSVTLVNDLPTYIMLVGLFGIVFAVCDDLRRRSPPSFPPKWTHWAGVLAFCVSNFALVTWNLLWWAFI